MALGKAVIINMQDIEVENVNWLWYPYIPFGKVTVIQGDPGNGKTTFILAVSSIVTNGLSFPATNENTAPANIIYQTAEDGLADTIKPRLLQYGADCSKVFVIDDSYKQLTLDDGRIEESINKVNAKVLVIDPLQAFLGADVDMHRANEIRPIFKKLADVAQRTGCAIIIIGHMNKSAGAKGIYRGLGSIDITAAARSVLLLGKDPNNPNVRAVIPIKSSLAPEGQAIAFELGENVCFKWLGLCDLTVDDLLAPPKMDRKRVIDDARLLLSELLKDSPLPSEEVLKQAKEKSISERTLYTAKKELGIGSIKVNDVWHFDKVANIAT